MPAKKREPDQKVMTSKEPGETEQQYLAWLLYCEAGSLQKLLRMWEGLRQGFGEVSSEFASRLGKPPTIRTLQTWSAQYAWVKRSDLKLEEDLLSLREETKHIAETKKYKVAEGFKRTIDLRMKQLRKGEPVTTADVKSFWEMFRTELGESLGKSETVHTINESEQNPLTPDEEELGREIDQVIKKHYERQRKTTKK